MDLEFKKLYLNDFLDEVRESCKSKDMSELIDTFKDERVKMSFKNQRTFEKSKKTDGDKRIFRSNNKKLKMIQDVFDMAFIYYDIKDWKSLTKTMNYILENDYNNRKKVSYSI